MREIETIDKEKEYNTFFKKVKICFPDIEITTLDKLVKNISLSPSVRTGEADKLDPSTKYYEVGLRDINEEGLVSIELCKDKQLGAANTYLVEKYALKENDLLIPYRASRDYKVSRVGSTYPAPLVTNASVIRIEMHKDSPKDIAILIQTYLLAWFVKQYILPKELYSPKREYSRHLISTKRLAQLPIPNFTTDMISDGNYEALFKNKKLLESKGRELINRSSNIFHCVDKESEQLLKLFLYDKEEIAPILAKEEILLEKMQDIINMLAELNEEVDCSRINQGPPC